MESWAEVERFHAKRARDEQTARARFQFGKGGPGIPDNPEDPEPTRMVKPVSWQDTVAVSEAA